MTLKTILKNFLNYADTLEAQKKLGKDLYEVDFQKLKGLTEELKHDKDYLTSEGLKDVNRRKNRYKDILPYDYTRVILSEYPGVPGSDYINANYIKGASGSLAYIASQGPLPNTVVDFWRMIWECEIQVIVMACNEQESGKYKCECYWPTDDEKKQYGNINVEFVKWRQVCPDFLVRTLKACWETEERVICQFHYTTWPDHGVPNSVQPILELVRLIRDCQASEAVPVLVHCSAGCGRTGTICAIDFVWGLMRMGKLSKNFNLFNVIADMRRQRIAMVQTKEQYVLVHKAVSSLFEQQLRVIDNHTYENLDEDGEPLILKELQLEDDIYEDIMEPLMGDLSTMDTKHEGKKLQTLKISQESIRGNSDSSFPVLKKDHLYSQTLSHGEIIKSSHLRENKDSSIKQMENDKISENNKDYDETDLSYTKNSRTLQRLCREESVKRLISGWNKAVEQSDLVKMICKDSQCELPNSKSPVSKNYPEITAPESKLSTTNAILPNQIHAYKSEHVPVTVEEQKRKSGLVEGHLSHDSSPKTSSPEDMHAGKLVGKATVIRRPSIAKLKALFEKSSQPHSESSQPHSDSTRQRRPLFRSHSHYVSNSSRTFTLSDSNAEEHNNSNYSGDNFAHNRSDSSIDRNNIIQSLDHSNSNYSNLNDSVHNSEKFESNLSTDFSQSVEESRERISSRHSTMYHNSKDNTPQNSFSKDISSDYSSESFFNSNSSSLINYTELSKEHDTGSNKKERPPELPTKKKVTSIATGGGNEKRHSENLVPRFQVNVLGDNQNYSEIRSKTFATEGNKTIADFPERGISNVKSPVSHEWNSEDYSKEYRRHSQEVEKKVLHKNQSFSDPEHCSSRPSEICKQVVTQKLSYTEQTYPKLSHAHGKTVSDDKLQHTYETTYMNVNPLAQKNIRQIEDSLKNHPRGAIIDLTSRKSYIDEMNVNSDKRFVFRNSSQLVKVLQPQESKDLTPHEKSTITKSENLPSATSAKSSIPSTSKSTEHKTDSTQKDSDLINSKNLLLHSPPPKSKRGHLSKTNSKSPISPPTTDVPVSAMPSNENKSAPILDEHQDKQTTHKGIQSTEFPISNSPSTTVASTTSIPAADRSDPRYFPVTRQTASEAKALNRDAYSAPYSSTGIYETLYSVKQPIFQKSTVYEKHKLENFDNVKTSTQETSKTLNESESLYGLQRSASGPQMLPSVPDSESNPLSTEGNKCQNVYSYTSDGNKKTNSSQCKESRQPPPYNQSHSYKHANTISQQNMFPLGPPKPPRTFHYDVKSSQERVPSSEAYEPQQIKRDGGRYIVTVASPKHSNHYILPSRNTNNQEHRYTSDTRVPDPKHHNVNSTQSHPPNYAPPLPMPNEVHMSRSYPLTHYDNVYSHPRPYGKQFYPESMTFRNVQPVSHMNNSIYGTVKEKQPMHTRESLYGTVKHRSAVSNYENMYDSQGDYMHAKINPSVRTEHSNQNIPSNSMSGQQYSQSDTHVYSVAQTQKPQTHIAKSSYNSVKPEYQNSDDIAGISSKRVYFDTLQRRHKQVSWEQRRSHDDMDIRTAPSARLREQIHARRSMVELDNLEISVASDDGYPEKSGTDPSIHSMHSKSSSIRGDRHNETTQVKTINTDLSKDSQHKKSCTHNKEASFGETLSKAFGKLTSLTKFSGKDAQSNNTSINEVSNNGSKVSKQKDKDKRHDFTLQSPNSKESPSEQWTQV